MTLKIDSLRGTKVLQTKLIRKAYQDAASLLLASVYISSLPVRRLDRSKVSCRDFLELGTNDCGERCRSNRTPAPSSDSFALRAVCRRVRIGFDDENCRADNLTDKCCISTYADRRSIHEDVIKNIL